MHTGMLWFNNDPKMLLSVKIQQAVDYYIKKYGRMPDLVLVHPSMLEEKDRTPKGIELEKITILPYRPVLPGHIWVGIEDKS